MLLPVFAGGGAYNRPDAVAFPDDIQSYTLAHLTLGVSVGQNSHVAVGVEVDEAWTYHQPAGVDDPIRLRAGNPADPGDLSASNTNVRVKPGVAGAIHNPSAEDSNVVYCHDCPLLARVLCEWSMPRYR